MEQLDASGTTPPPRDGEFRISVADDLLSASLFLVPPDGGGKAVSLSDIEQVLLDQGICHGVLHDQIAAALNVGYCEAQIIAQGQAPTAGTPAIFQSLLDEVEQQLSMVDEDAVIKFSDLSHLLLAQPGDALMRLAPAAQGTAGMNIKGEAVSPEPVPEMSFPDNLQGAAPAPGDPTLLLATVAGQPVLCDNGVFINPVIEVANVDLTTGNIKFDGTVRVGSDVKVGMKIEASGDVFVEGAVEAAEIVAGGNVVVTGGIVGIGRAETRTGGTHGLPANTASITCKGSVQALFMENARIEAGAAISIGRGARQCELTAHDDIIVGYADPRQSQLAGGVTRAGQLVQAVALGSRSGVKTRVEVGFDPYLEDNLAKNAQDIDKKQNELLETSKAMLFLSKNPQKSSPALVAKLQALHAQLYREIDTLTAAKDTLVATQELVTQAQVEVLRTLHYGVEIQIGKESWKASEDRGKAVIRLEGGAIRID